MAECRRRFPNEQLVVLWLGSSVGNLKPAEAVQFFRDMTAGAGSNIQVNFLRTAVIPMSLKGEDFTPQRQRSAQP